MRPVYFLGWHQCSSAGEGSGWWARVVERLWGVFFLFFYVLFVFFLSPSPTQTACLLSCNGLRACPAALGIKLKPLSPCRKTVHYGGARLLCKLCRSSLRLLIIKDYRRGVQGLHHSDDVTSLKWAGTAFRHICSWRKNIDWYMQAWAEAKTKGKKRKRKRSLCAVLFYKWR